MKAGSALYQADCSVPAAAKGQRTRSIELDSKVLFLHSFSSYGHAPFKCSVYVVCLPMSLITSQRADTGSYCVSPMQDQ